MKIQIMLHQHQRQQYNQPPAKRQRLFTGVASWLGVRSRGLGGASGAVRSSRAAAHPLVDNSMSCSICPHEMGGGRRALLGLCLFVNSGGGSAPESQLLPSELMQLSRPSAQQHT
ncbi:hypothetical protein KR032_002567, partial [Drosophila birchii]